jgi:hypothetical protein
MLFSTSVVSLEPSLVSNQYSAVTLYPAASLGKRKRCENPCGTDSQLCCEAGEYCYTDGNDQAVCGTSSTWSSSSNTWWTPYSAESWSATTTPSWDATTTSSWKWESSATATATSDPVSLADFPPCAQAVCVNSGELGPARLGCKQREHVLTEDCLCSEAVQPLACAPAPSDEDNCFFNVQQWFAGICPSVKEVKSGTMPECMSDCVTSAMHKQGCPVNGDTNQVTVNCFCALKDKAVIKTADGCWADIASCTSPFNASAWRQDICSLGRMNAYNNWADDPGPSSSVAVSWRARFVGLLFGVSFAIGASS